VPNFDIRKLIFIAVPLLIALAGALFYIGWSKRNLSGPVTISVNSLYTNAPVFIDGNLVGNTPYKGQKNISAPLSFVIKGEPNSFETTIRPSPGTEVSISRDLGVSGEFSSGRTVFIEKSNTALPSISIVSTPVGVEVTVDGIAVGKTPVAISDPKIITPDKEHKVKLSLAGYEGQSISVIPKKWYRANAIVDLFLLPLRENPKELAESTDSAKIFGIVNPEVSLKIPHSVWVRAISYYKKTRGGALVEFSYFVDLDGVVYKIGTGEVEDLANFSPPESAPSPLIIGALQTSAGPLSEKAVSSIQKILGAKGTVTSSKKATVLETGTDFGLNVRSGAGVAFEKIGELKVGTIVDILEENSGWTKVKFDGTKEGWVSSSYLSSK